MAQVRPALLHLVRSAWRPLRVAAAVALPEGRVEPVRGPLPDVPGRVVQPVAVGRRTNRPARCRRKPSARVFWAGKSPCQTFMRCSPPGSSSSPHGNALASSPPRAARSHSASVGSRVAAHALYATASFQETWTTGWSTRPSSVESGPSGCAQSAPSTFRHHGVCATASVGGKSSGQKTREDERPAVALRLGHVPGRLDERREARRSSRRTRRSRTHRARPRAPGPRRPSG